MGELRQIQSFLLLGAEVHGLCWAQGVEGSIPFVPTKATGRWMGMREKRALHPAHGANDTEIIRNLIDAVRSVDPDLIIVGNLHGASWPVELFGHLRLLEAVTVAYMHDLYLVTGRCAYPGDCVLYKEGCNATCPTAHEYPSLAPDRIGNAWTMRRRIFCGREGITLAANSRWTLARANEAMPDLCFGDVVYLGLDTDLFRPVEKGAARRILGLPESEFIVSAGAINLNDLRKGGPILDFVRREVRGEVRFLFFGGPPQDKDDIFYTGLQRDYRKMPLFYSASDVFLTVAKEEAFGQTICEASACGVPIVATSVGGVAEIARHNVNARLISDFSVPQIVSEIREMMAQPERLEALGKAGRALAETEFNLQQQGRRWMGFLNSLTNLPQVHHRSNAATPKT
jgi:glycosyltransferase involved in cell wall biosynthesis